MSMPFFTIYLGSLALKVMPLLAAVLFLAGTTIVGFFALRERRKLASPQPILAPDTKQIPSVKAPLKSFAQNLQEEEAAQVQPEQPESLLVLDRYRYISAMARRGMGSEQIMAALQIGEGEVKQIVRLAGARK